MKKNTLFVIVSILLIVFAKICSVFNYMFLNYDFGYFFYIIEIIGFAGLLPFFINLYKKQ